MTNTIYFYLDDASYSTSSSSPDSILSRQQSQQGFGPAVGEASSSSVVVAAEAINALIRPPSWVNREQVDKPDQNLSSNSASFTFRSEGEISHFSNLKSFSFKELKTATNNFSPDYLLGQGGFGKVFKGWMDEYKLTATKPGTGTAVAVKRLHQESLQGHEQWLAEINHLGQLDHLNLVKLIGSCLDNQERLLVYEFMPESLDNHLFRRNSYGQLSWSIRMKIALGTAKALAFLHSAEVNVIHRGCKSSNILLDLNYNAKLSDFGVARDGPTGDMSHVYTSVMGTQGYACPEYIGTGRLSAKSDVYSFGVVLLEILSGRRAIDVNRPSGQRNLLEWAMPYLRDKHRFFRVVDNHLDGQYSRGSAKKAAHLAVQCLANEAKLRPTIDVVVTALEQLQESINTKKHP